MDLDSFFEDIEAKLEAESLSQGTHDALERANLLRLYWADGGFIDLIAVLLGEDFVAGMALGQNDWRLIRLDATERVEFSVITGVDIPTIRFFDGTRRTFLERLTLPLSITWRFSSSGQQRRGILVDLKGECLVIEVVGSVSPIGVSLARVATLGVDSVENFNEFS
jgi:hypothetical protein